METIRAILQHMVHDKDTIPNKNILLMVYRNVLAHELRHWKYQEKCWNEGDYASSGEDAKVEALEKCAQRIRIINGILDELES